MLLLVESMQAFFATVMRHAQGLWHLLQRAGLDMQYA